jgi:hypothetical protein
VPPAGIVVHCAADVGHKPVPLPNSVLKTWVGGSTWNSPPAVPVGELHQPDTSNNTSADALDHTVTRPAASSFATTVFDTGTSAEYDNDATSGRDPLPSHTVNWPSALLNANAFNATAATPDPGIPPSPATCTDRDPPAGIVTHSAVAP